MQLDATPFRTPKRHVRRNYNSDPDQDVYETCCAVLFAAIIIFAVFAVVLAIVYVSYLNRGPTSHPKNMPFIPRPPMPFTTYPNVTVRALRPDILKNDAPQDEDQIRIAYLMMIHSRDTAWGAARLLRRLYHIKHTFVIHVDLDVGLPEREVQDLVLQYFDLEMRAFMVRHNVRLVSYHKVLWGGVSIVQAELDLMQVAQATKRYWDYAILLSGRCYPVNTIPGIEGALKVLRGPKALREKFDWRDYDLLPANGKETPLPEPNQLLKAAELEKVTTEDLKGHDFASLFGSTKMIWANLLASNGFGGMTVEWKKYRIEKFICFEGRGDVICPTPIRGVREDDHRVISMVPNLKFGSQWFVMSRPFTEWLTGSATARNALVLSTNMHIPDESMFQTLAYMSPWRDHSVWEPAVFPMPIRPERWNEKNCGSGPCSLELSDLEEIFRTGALNHFDFSFSHTSTFSVKTFARKFDPWSDTQYNFVHSKLGIPLVFGPNKPLATLDEEWWWTSSPDS